MANVVGAPVPRVEDQRLLRGAGQFVGDLQREGLLHAAIVRSALAHGVIRGLDTAPARAMPGVRAIYTAADVARVSGGSVPTIPLRLAALPQMVPFEQPVIAVDKVRYVGEPLAIVVAQTAAQAQDAAEAVLADIEALEAVADRRSSKTVPLTYEVARGDAAAAAAAAPYRRRERFSVQRHTAVPMETRGLLAEWNGAAAKLTVSGAAKVPFATRRVLARCMDLPEDCIDMIEYDVGGGFGVRGEFYPEDYLVPFAARRLGAPVKWIESRNEHLLGTNHARDMECELEIACERDGTIRALSGHIWVDLGAYARTSGAVPPRTAALLLSGPYRVPHIHIESSMVLTNKAPAGTYRGPGYFENSFFRERLFDLAAKDLGLDPVEFRRRNLVTKEEMPYAMAPISPVPRDDALDSGDTPDLLERCLAEIGWTEKSALQGRLVEGRYHGLGVGCFVESGGAGPRENARIEIDRNGQVLVYVGSTSVGQSLETSLSQIAADALGVPMERIRLFHGSTTYLKEGFGSYHSRSVVVGGCAILDTAQKLKQQLGVASLAGLDLRAFAGAKAEGAFDTHHHTYANGVAAAHVAVDPATGMVEVLDYVMVEDVGRIINPMTLHGQAIGGVVQGLGGTLLEHLAYDAHGQLLSGTFMDYAMPIARHFPNIRAIMLENSPSPNNALGAKGAGDGGIIPVGGVIGNAVAAALAPLGVHIAELPLSAHRIWKLIHERSDTA